MVNIVYELLTAWLIAVLAALGAGPVVEGPVESVPFQNEDHTPDAPPAGQYYATIEELTAECFAGGFPESPACDQLRVEAIIRTGDGNLILFEDGSVTGYGCVLAEMGCGIDTLAEDWDRIAPLLDENGEFLNETIHALGIQPLYCAPEIAADPVLSVHFNCGDALVN